MISYADHEHLKISNMWKRVSIVPVCVLFGLEWNIHSPCRAYSSLLPNYLNYERDYFFPNTYRKKPLSWSFELQTLKHRLDKPQVRGTQGRHGQLERLQLVLMDWRIMRRVCLAFWLVSFSILFSNAISLSPGFQSHFSPYIESAERFIRTNTIRTRTESWHCKCPAGGC